MKIYTKKGDAGKTSLSGGTKVSKNSLRIEAYGTVDELNSVLGVVLAHSPPERVKQILIELQQQLFVLGADLATPLTANTRIDRMNEPHVDRIESIIDELDTHLPPLKNFILPGGDQCGSILHMARTVCRRAERAAVACSETETVNAHSIRYLNRLSDLLFVLARYANHQADQIETVWKPDKE